MAWMVVLVDEVTDWYLGLVEREPETADLVEAAIDLLEEEGPAFGASPRRHGLRLDNPEHEGIAAWVARQK